MALPALKTLWWRLRKILPASPVPTPRPQPSFLSLPAQVRNRIYGYCTPFTGHIEQLQGLMLSCKQVKTEYEAEAVHAIAKLFDNVGRDWPHDEELRLSTPTTLREMAEVTIELPVSLYYASTTTTNFQATGDWITDIYGPPHEDTKLETCLAPIFRLHLTLLTIKFYSNNDTSTNVITQNPRQSPRGLVNDLANAFIFPIPLNCEMWLWPLRFNRAFRLGQPLRVRRLVYVWREHVSEEGVLVLMKYQLANIIGMEDCWVKRWGYDDREMWFEME